MPTRKTPDLTHALTPTAAAAKIGRSYQKIQRAISDGLLPAHRVGVGSRGELRILPEDLDAYVAAEDKTTQDRRIDTYIKNLVESAPDFTPAQRDKLAALLQVS